jgi:vitamin-K-epoxide reductase (warfarin-sensitive)
MVVLLVLALLGVGISAYAYWVETRLAYDPKFKPFCDINDRISCTKPLQSPYSALFYVSNATVAMLYYALVALLYVFAARHLLLWVSVLSMLVTLVLAYLLYVKIRSLCLVCTSLYIINVLILVEVIREVL